VLQDQEPMLAWAAPLSTRVPRSEREPDAVSMALGNTWVFDA